MKSGISKKFDKNGTGFSINNKFLAPLPGTEETLVVVSEFGEHNINKVNAFFVHVLTSLTWDIFELRNKL